MVHNDSQRDADNTLPDTQKSFLIIFACRDYYLLCKFITMSYMEVLLCLLRVRLQDNALQKSSEASADILFEK